MKNIKEYSASLDQHLQRFLRTDKEQGFANFYNYLYNEILEGRIDKEEFNIIMQQDFKCKQDILNFQKDYRKLAKSYSTGED